MIITSPRVPSQIAMRELINLFIPGTPVPQGSKRYLGKGIMIDDNPKLKTWRHDIRQAILSMPEMAGVMMIPYEGAVQAQMEFRMPRPKYLAKKKITPPHTKKPDLDKLVRAVFDAIVSTGLIKDDAQVIRLKDVEKRYAAEGTQPGLWLHLTVHPWHKDQGK